VRIVKILSNNTFCGPIILSITRPTSIKYVVLAAFIIAAGVYWLVKRRSSIDVTNSKD
jgi:hypothetical protein